MCARPTPWGRGGLNGLPLTPCTPVGWTAYVRPPGRRRLHSFRNPKRSDVYIPALGATGGRARLCPRDPRGLEVHVCTHRTPGGWRWPFGLPEPQGGCEGCPGFCGRSQAEARHERRRRRRQRTLSTPRTGQSEERAEAQRKHRGEGRAGACRRRRGRSEERARQVDDEGPGMKRPEPNPNPTRTQPVTGRPRDRGRCRRGWRAATPSCPSVARSPPGAGRCPGSGS